MAWNMRAIYLVYMFIYTSVEIPVMKENTGYAKKRSTPVVDVPVPGVHLAGKEMVVEKPDVFTKVEKPVHIDRLTEVPELFYAAEEPPEPPLVEKGNEIPGM
ncbi:uncharacterized protein O3C94_002727 [Discoglossus pictus]